jgi:hypothetical protein
VLKVSGPCLAFAVAKAMHLPSISAVRNRLYLPHLLPSIGFPTRKVLLANIDSFFGPDTAGSSLHPQTGLSLMIHEIALQSRLQYSIQQDAVVGLCLEHGSQIDLTNMSTQSDTLDALLKAKSLLDSGDCHRARESTMAAIAQFGQSNYKPAVVLASGTYKAEKTPDQACLIRLILDSWKESPFGEAAHGEIWSACTDGDPGQRRAMFKLCMTSRLLQTSDLFHLIGHLPWLNLYCGPAQITHDGDYKHEAKSK